MSARILDVTTEQYHADPCDAPSLSSSIAKILATKSPAHAWLAHPKLGGRGMVPTRKMDAGSVAHALLLGKGAEIVAVDADDFKTKAAREARDSAREAGKIPCLAGELEDIAAAVHIIADKLSALGVRMTGRSELAVTWQEDVFLTDAQVACRGMFDHAMVDDGVFFDLKTTANANPDFLVRHIYEMGYDIQDAAYRSAIRALNPACAGREKSLFIFAELEAPYSVTLISLDGQYREVGETRWRNAVRAWHQCTTTGEWPGYAQGPVVLSPPSWALSKLFEEAAE